MRVDSPLEGHLETNQWYKMGEGDYINAMITMGFCSTPNASCGSRSSCAARG